MASSKQTDQFSPNGMMTIEQRAIYATNATASPLLLLPAELRSLVWLEVLGSQTIHISPPLLTLCPLSGVVSSSKRSQNPSTAYRCQLSVGDRDHALHFKAVGGGTLRQRSTSIACVRSRTEGI
ncbi:hypothetical protein B0A54_14504 [Friedmanniomyces endolithicus]|uniref:Uncharacterized protein n=1 Tax=Friedmanniomyces endolithicus TaxID=329885 RepID=A0A4U0U8W8_9PEZI|nr:hypothetical protein B0A54_14504 [Friedmanniomyces endolithicus]